MRAAARRVIDVSVLADTGGAAPSERSLGMSLAAANSSTVELRADADAERRYVDGLLRSADEALRKGGDPDEEATLRPKPEDGATGPPTAP